MSIDKLLNKFSDKEYMRVISGFKEACEMCKLKETDSNLKLYVIGILHSKKIYNG